MTSRSLPGTSDIHSRATAGWNKELLFFLWHENSCYENMSQGSNFRILVPSLSWPLLLTAMWCGQESVSLKRYLHQTCMNRNPSVSYSRHLWTHRSFFFQLLIAIFLSFSFLCIHLFPPKEREGILFHHMAHEL